MNNVMLLGRLTKDVELKEAKSTKYAQFTLAVDDESNRDQTNFINCVVFGKTAEALVKYCGKGRQLLLNGYLRISTHNKRDYYSVVASNLVFLHDPHAKDNPPVEKDQADAVSVDDQDLPF